MSLHAPDEKFRPVLLLGGALVLLQGLSWLPLDGTFGHVRIRRVTPFANAWSNARPASGGPDRISALADEPDPPAVPASASLGRAARTGSAPAPRGLPANAGQPVEFPGKIPFTYVNTALAELGTSREVVRVAYFGDSLVEGDMMVGDLRHEFQSTFGGGGVGFLPVTSEVARFRPTVGHAYSKGWRVSTVLDHKPHVPLGFGGQVWTPPCTPNGCTGWFEYSVTSRLRTLSAIRMIRVYVGRVPPGASLTVTADERPDRVVALEEGEALRETPLVFDPPARRVRVVVSAPSPLSIYGAAWDDDGGMVVDNFALRSHSGLGLVSIPATMLQEVDRLRHYDLVVVHYGTNVANPESNMGKWYEAGMTRAIAHLRASLPNTDFLVVSVADRSYNQDGIFTTVPSIPSLVAHQRKAAETNGAAFWDLYSAMGGANAMVAWVNHDPPLASLDYTHFSYVGGKRVAKALFRALIATVPPRELHETR